jgi:GNAT superfamily N-acetyltransferase
MLIRFAKLQDKQEIFGLMDELLINGFRKKGEEYLKAPNLDKEREKVFEEEINKEDIKIFVAEDVGKIIGMSEVFITPILRWGYHQAVVETLVITEDLRGRGVGTKLLERIFEFCKEKGIRVVKIASILDLKEAHEFYEKLGGKFNEKVFRFDL